jgi:ferric-dicitrate binding protein FerR (iron transport regulator)
MAAEQRISGTFNANETAAFLDFLKNEPSLAIERAGDAIEIRSH